MANANRTNAQGRKDANGSTLEMQKKNKRALKTLERLRKKAPNQQRPINDLNKFFHRSAFEYEAIATVAS